MRVENTTNKISSSEKLVTSIKKYKWLWLIVVGGGIMFVAFMAAIKVVKPDLYVKGMKLAKAPVNYVKSLPVEPEVIRLDIKHENFQKLAYNRKVALSRGKLLPDCRDEVKAEMQYGGEAIEVKVRLKGDLPDHWKHESKWSLRVKIKDDNNVHGMKYFSLQQPRTRGYMIEWLMHRLLKDNGYLAIKYDFVKLFLNGKDLGAYAVEESFEKQLVEGNRFREGVILKFDDELFWQDAHRNMNYYDEVFMTSPVDAFGSGKIKESGFAKQFAMAKNLLESFRRGDLPASQTFNVERIAGLFAIMDLFGHSHAVSFRNIRFYYNPITASLEPIAYDNGHIYDNQQTGILINHRDEKIWIDRFFSDPKFTEAYVRHLEVISDPAFLDEFMAKNQDDFDKSLATIQQSFPWYVFADLPMLFKNRDQIGRVLNPTKGLYAYSRKVESNQMAVELGNISALPIEVLNLKFKDGARMMPESKTIIEGKKPLKQIDFQNRSFGMPEGLTLIDSLVPELQVEYKFVGSKNTMSESIFPWPNYDDEVAATDIIRKDPNSEKFEFLFTEESSKTIVIKPGEWTLEENLILPTGYTIKAGPGVSIDMKNEANIISYSPVKFIGNEDEPIRIYSSDSTAQGFVILNAKEKSKMEYVHFDNLSNPRQGTWSLPGAVSLYESPVDIDHCNFSNNRIGDDLLNIFRAEFTISDSNFLNTNSDAFDGDFCNGIVRNTTFINSGNDGVDVSGSYIKLEGVSFKGVGDKALSSGENSEMICTNIVIDGAELGVTSKDKSTIDIAGVTIRNTKIGFSAFQKKPEFGPAHIVATGVKLENTDISDLIEEGSSLKLEGKDMPPSRDNVKEILYGAEFGKATVK